MSDEPSRNEIEAAGLAAIATLRRKCPSLSDADRDEVVQTALIEALPRHDPDRGTYRALVVTTAHKRALDLLRRRSRETAPVRSRRARRPQTEAELIEATKAEAARRVGPDVVAMIDQRGVDNPEWRAWAEPTRVAARRAVEAIDALLEVFPHIGADGTIDLAELRFWATREINRCSWPGFDPDNEAAVSILSGNLPALKVGEDTPADVLKREAANIRRERNKRAK